jgi:hypothetical protein
MKPLEEWAKSLKSELGKEWNEFKDGLKGEVEELADTVREVVTVRSGRLRKSIRVRGLEVISRHRGAKFHSTGGLISAKKHEFLTIPVRKGYRRAPKYLTIKRADGDQFVIRRGTRELWAIRRRQVYVRGSRYLDKALERHIQETGERVAKGAEKRLG